MTAPHNPAAAHPTWCTGAPACTYNRGDDGHHRSEPRTAAVGGLYVSVCLVQGHRDTLPFVITSTAEAGATCSVSEAWEFVDSLTSVLDLATPAACALQGGTR